MSYKLLYGFLYLISLLPFWVLYGLSDGVYVLLYYLVKYRRDIVAQHLEQAFTELSLSERKKIEKEFYHSFCDQWIETLKLLSIKKSVILKRCTGNYQGPNAMLDDGRPAFVLMGHQFNWEYACFSAGHNSERPMAGLYLPLKNKAFDRLMLHLRKRSDNFLLAATDGIKEHVQFLNTEPIVLGIIADQTPGGDAGNRWYHFLGKEAPFALAPEKLAKRGNASVYFGSIRKIKRGYYDINFQHICCQAADQPLGFITSRYVAMLEQSIQSQPSNYMWTHRRWKKAKQENTQISAKSLP